MGAHYEETEEQLVTVCPLGTMRAMALLGLKAMPTDNHLWGIFEGYGVKLQIPSDMELDVVGAMKCIVEQARAQGVRDWKAMFRKMLEM